VLQLGALAFAKKDNAISPGGDATRRQLIYMCSSMISFDGDKTYHLAAIMDTVLLVSDGSLFKWCKEGQGTCSNIY
jgi:hypothetical protein